MTPLLSAQDVAAAAIAQVRFRRANNREAAPYPEYSHNPLGYIRGVLRLGLTPDQEAVALALVEHRRVLVESGHGVGKTFLAAAIVSWYFDTHEPAIVLSTAPTWPQTYQLLWAEVSRQRRRAGVVTKWLGRWKGIGVYMGRSETSYAQAHNAESGEAFQGRHQENVLVVLDEGPGVPSYVWEAAETMLQSPSCRALAIGNPTTLSGPYWAATQDVRWNVLRVSCLDHPNIAAELRGEEPPFPSAVRLGWVREMIEAHCAPGSPDEADCFEFDGAWWKPDDDFRPHVLGFAPRQASRAVWDETWLDRARTLGLHDNEVRAFPPELGCDVARYGSDETVIFVRRGNKILWAEGYRHLDIMEVAGKIISAALRAWPEAPKEIRLKVDATGLGAGVVDCLREQGYRVIAVEAASSPLSSGFPNARSELWFGVADRAKERRLDLSALLPVQYNRLRTDILAATFRHDSQGRRVVEPKEEARKRLGRSPDWADALNLAFYGLERSGGSRELVVDKAERGNVTDRGRRGPILVGRMR